jgi:hypothetical protein
MNGRAISSLGRAPLGSPSEYPAQKAARIEAHRLRDHDEIDECGLTLSGFEIHNLGGRPPQPSGKLLLGYVHVTARDLKHNATGAPELPAFCVGDGVDFRLPCRTRQLRQIGRRRHSRFHFIVSFPGGCGRRSLLKRIFERAAERAPDASQALDNVIEDVRDLETYANGDIVVMLRVLAFKGKAQSNRHRVNRC